MEQDKRYYITDPVCRKLLTKLVNEYEKTIPIELDEEVDVYFTFRALPDSSLQLTHSDKSITLDIHIFGEPYTEKEVNPTKLRTLLEKKLLEVL